MPRDDQNNDVGAFQLAPDQRVPLLARHDLPVVERGDLFIVLKQSQALVQQLQPFDVRVRRR